MIVVDTNILVYFFITGEYSQQVEHLFNKDPQWVSPILWRSEFCNVLVTYLHRRLLDLEGAQAILRKALELMDGRDFLIMPDKVLELAVTNSCSAYDCEYVVLSKELGVPLITTDHKILEKFPEQAIPIGLFLSE